MYAAGGWRAGPGQALAAALRPAYVVMLPESEQRPEVAAFVAWLHDEARGAASAQAPVQ